MKFIAYRKGTAMIRDKWYISEEYKNTNIAILFDNLSALRARIGITKEELASVLGISRQTYYAIENGNRKMSWSMFLAILFFFDNIIETSEMLKELRIYPVDLMIRFNKQNT